MNLKPLIIIIPLITLVYLAFITTQTALYLNFLLGNDVIINIESEDFSKIMNTETKALTFHTSVLTNPFCTAECYDVYRELSFNTKQSNPFLLRTGIPYNKEYDYETNEFGEGIELVNYEVSCKGSDNFLCHTSQEWTTRNNLIVIERKLNSTDEMLKPEVRNKLNKLSEQIAELKTKAKSIEINSNKTEKIKINLSEALEFWMQSNFERTDLIISKVEKDYKIRNANVVLSIQEIKEGIEERNQRKRKYLELFNKINCSNSTAELYNKHNLSNLEKIELCENCSCNYTVNLIKPNFTFENFTEVPKIKPLEIPEPKRKCCYDNQCGECGNNKTPILFLHGHAFNRDVSAEYSLDAFNYIQDSIDYIDAGFLTLDYEKNLSEVPEGVSFKASYYFDIYDNYRLIQTKSENIDTYAIRLKDIIDKAKRVTGKNKVKIVAHSMGGLVARRYMQIFGEDNVEELVLIVTPNKGIAGNVLEYCPIIGENLECRDMNSKSLLINKLKNQKFSIPVVNVIGTGCKMDKGTGDGVVLEKNAFLENATNIYFNGTCTFFEPLHTEILKEKKIIEIISP